MGHLYRAMISLQNRYLLNRNGIILPMPSPPMYFYRRSQLPVISPDVGMIYGRSQFPVILPDVRMINGRFHQYINGHGAGNGKVYYRVQPFPQPPPVLIPVYRRRYVAVGSYESHERPEAITYESQVIEGTSSQSTRKPPLMKDLNCYNTNFTHKYSDWSPLDDGIIMSPNFTASREAFNARVDFILKGSSRRKRLPVFASLSSE